MSESRHSEIRLSLTEGTADKEYQAWLEQVDGHFHVDFAYGRRGTALKTGRKTASPLPLEEAAAALARLVRSKEAKGYTRDASGAAYRATDLAGRVSGHAVQLLNPIEEADLEALLVSTQHVTQEKFDGCRLLVEKGPEGVRGVNKLGRTRAQVQALRHGHGARDRPQRHKAFGVARVAECERVDGCGG